MLKFFRMAQLPSFPMPGRRRRPWVSYVIAGAWQGGLALAVYRVPVIRGSIAWHLAWLHRIVPQ